jgi:hypothetical protein
LGQRSLSVYFSKGPFLPALRQFLPPSLFLPPVVIRQYIPSLLFLLFLLSLVSLIRIIRMSLIQVLLIIKRIVNQRRAALIIRRGAREKFWGGASYTVITPGIHMISNRLGAKKQVPPVGSAKKGIALQVPKTAPAQVLGSAKKEPGARHSKDSRGDSVKTYIP